MYIHHKKFYWHPSICKEGLFYYWICIFRPKSSFLWSKSGSLKKALCMQEFQNYFFRPLFTIIFRPKILILYTYFTLSTKKKHESVVSTNYIPFSSQQSELLGYIDPQLPTPHLKFPVQWLSVSQSPSLILQGFVSEQHVQKLAHAENEFW